MIFLWRYIMQGKIVNRFNQICVEVQNGDNLEYYKTQYNIAFERTSKHLMGETVQGMPGRFYGTRAGTVYATAQKPFKVVPLVKVETKPLENKTEPIKLEVVKKPQKRGRQKSK